MKWRAGGGGGGEIFKCKLISILASTICQTRLAKKTWISVFDVVGGGGGGIKCSGWGGGGGGEYIQVYIKLDFGINYLSNKTSKEDLDLCV